MRVEQHWLRTTPIAHRGVHDDEIPENSLPAFETAVREGYGIELDVHTTADGRLVVLHDADLFRMTGSEGLVVDTPLARLGELRLLGTEHTIPTLDDVLRLVGGRVPVLVEIKPNARMDVTGVALAEVLRGYAGPLAVQSFDPRVLRWLKKHLPEVVRGQLSGTLADAPLRGWQRALLRAMVFNLVTRPDFLAYEIDALPSWSVAVWRRLLNVPVLTWTVRTSDQRHRADRCAANVIFEDVLRGNTV